MKRQGYASVSTSDRTKFLRSNSHARPVLTIDCTSVLPESGGIGAVAVGVARGLAEAGYSIVCLTVPSGEKAWQATLGGVHWAKVRPVNITLDSTSRWQNTLRKKMPQRLRRSPFVGFVRNLRRNSVKKHLADEVTWLPFHRAYLATTRGVVTVHDLRAYERDLGSAMDRRVIAENITRAAAVVCSWAHPADHLLTHFPAAKDKLFQIPLPLLRAGEPVHRHIPQGGPIRLIYPAFITPHKNHETLVHAMTELPNAVLTLTGSEDGLYAADMRRLAARLRVADRIRWLGHVSDDELETEFGDAHILVMPTRWEAASGPVYEAIARELPVVASDIAPIRSQLNEVGAPATLFDPDAPQALVEAVRSVATTYTDRRAELRAPGLLLRQRTWTDTAADYARVFDWVGGRGAWPIELAVGARS